MKKMYYIEDICVCCGRPAEENSMMCSQCAKEIRPAMEVRQISYVYNMKKNKNKMLIG